MLPENAGNLEKIRNVQQRQAKASFIFILRVRSCFCFAFFFLNFFFFASGIYIFTAPVSREDIRAVFLQVRLVLDCDFFLILNIFYYMAMSQKDWKQTNSRI